MKVVAVVSGGMDSVTMLYGLKTLAEEVVAISFNYGQRHSKELEAAKATCDALGIQHDIVDIRSITGFISNSALTSDIEVPEGHYEDANMSKTVVPSRNSIMALIANGYAMNIAFDAIALGVHAGDHAIYPDCRPEFIEALRDLFRVNNYTTCEVLAPFLADNKISILKTGIEMGVDYSKTWTCYNGREKACGKCGSCQERLEAFKENNIEDPLEYETREILSK